MSDKNSSQKYHYIITNAILKGVRSRKFRQFGHASHATFTRNFCHIQTIVILN